MPTTTNPLWNRTLGALMPFAGRDVSIRIAANDGWLVALCSGTLDSVEVVSMRNGDGGEDARLCFDGGAFPNQV